MSSLHPLEVRCPFCGAGKSINCLSNSGEEVEFTLYHSDRIDFSKVLSFDDRSEDYEIISLLTNFIYNSVPELTIRSSRYIALDIFKILDKDMRGVLTSLLSDKPNISLSELLLVVFKI